MSNFDKRQIRQLKIMAIKHLVMGLLYVVLAFVLLRNGYFGAIKLGGTTTYVLAVVLVLYGGFRIYRGVIDYKDAKAFERDLLD